MSDPIDLLAGFDGPDATVAWRGGRPIPCGAFLGDVAALAARLPDRGHVLNVATDRYRFAVGLAAAIVRGQISLLPPTTHAHTVAQLLARFPDAYCLADAAERDIDLPQTLVDADGSAPHASLAPIPTDRTVAYVFTSGSTGAPTLHRKRWGSLVANVRGEASRLGCAAGMPPHAIVATVPPQHMFGFESSLLIAWQSGNAFVAERPFYPADIAAALARLPAPRMLVTTPFHLRAAITDDFAWPPLARVVCATAPLSPALAAQAERRLAAPVLEIYGCTETGQLASRRPVVDPHWQLFDGVRIAFVDGRAFASGGHVEQPTPLADVIEPADDIAVTGRFLLGGRASDVVNVAGKRTSLGHLDLQLNAIDGVLDGVFVMPDEDARDGVVRLAAVVVAPTLDARRLIAALRQRIDPVFLPRPVHFVDRIPRNDTGKVTHAALAALLASLPASSARDDAQGANPVAAR
jgi:acyl-coenzyme A synthetase/AMP-(fatty) acid ligase